MDRAAPGIGACSLRDVVIVGVIVTGVVVIMLFVLLRPWLTRVRVNLRKGRVDADMKRDEPPEGGIRQQGIKAGGTVRARDETGMGASQYDVTSDGDVEAIVTAPRGRNDRRKKT